MAKNYIIFILSLVTLIGISLYQYSVFRDNILQEKSNQLLKMAQVAGRNMTREFDHFENEISILNDQRFIDAIVLKNISTETTRRLKQFFFRNEDMVSKISFFNEKGMVSVWKTPENHFHFEWEPQTAGYENLLKKKVETLKNFMFVTYAGNAGQGEHISGIRVTLDLQEYAKALFKGFHLGKQSWRFFISPDLFPVYADYSESTIHIDFSKFRKKDFEPVLQEIREGFQGVSEIKSDYDGKPVHLLTAYFPISFFSDQYGLIFSLDKSALLTSLNAIILVTVLISAGLIGAMISLFMQINKRNHHITLKLKENQGKLLEDIATRKKMESQLKKAKLKAEAADHAKSVFLANVSHEIRTPMNSILGFTELCLGDPSLPEHLKSNLEISHESAHSLLLLINDILDLSKLESGKLTIENRPYSLHALMKEIENTLAIQVNKKGLELNIDIAPDIPGSLLGDSYRLRQIILNLANNAVKFTPKGSVTIQVTLLKDEEKLQFAVSDTGIGIPEDRLENIFESFMQADASTTRQYGGTGLGTTIARDLVALMSGKMWVESQEGKGTTFYFTVETRPTDQVIPPGDILTPDDVMFDHGFNSGYHVLLVEDVQANVDLAKIRLEKQLHKVTVARNGLQAVEAFQSNPDIDVILMDIHMPEMNGIQAVKQIRKLENQTDHQVPIIAMTAGVMIDEQKSYFLAGMDAVVAKPIEFKKLFNAMDRLILKFPRAKYSENTNASLKQSAPAFIELKGIDTQKGLKTWLDPDVYSKAMVNFADDFQSAGQRIERLMEQGRFDDIRYLAHTIKGTAANLYAGEVAARAEAIEAAAGQVDKKGVKNALPEFNRALAGAVSQIVKLKKDNREQHQAQGACTPPNQEELKQILIDLLNSLEQLSPYKAEPYLDKLRMVVSPDDLEPVVDSVRRFNFDDAGQNLIRLAEQLKIDI